MRWVWIKTMCVCARAREIDLYGFYNPCRPLARPARTTLNTDCSCLMCQQIAIRNIDESRFPLRVFHLLCY